MYSTLVFDLDGTISDPLEGIAKSINHSLKMHGYDEESMDRFAEFIGPPMDFIFKSLTNESDPQTINSLISVYRDRYSKKGYAENKLYEGIVDLLKSLREKRYRLGVCTSKRRDFAMKILQMFDLDVYFSFIDGGDIGITKDQQLKTLLVNGDIDKNTVMIGDRSVDIHAARANGLASVGVLWGYGNKSELENAGASFLVDDPAQLLKLLGARFHAYYFSEKGVIHGIY